VEDGLMPQRRDASVLYHCWCCASSALLRRTAALPVTASELWLDKLKGFSLEQASVGWIKEAPFSKKLLNLPNLILFIFIIKS